MSCVILSFFLLTASVTDSRRLFKKFCGARDGFAVVFLQVQNEDRRVLEQEVVEAMVQIRYEMETATIEAFRLGFQRQFLTLQSKLKRLCDAAR
jgi:hypothetical protein